MKNKIHIAAENVWQAFSFVLLVNEFYQHFGSTSVSKQ